MRAMDLRENINAVNNVKWSIVEWFLLVSYLWIIKEEKYISSQRKLLRLISLHAGLQGDIKARTIGLHSVPTGLRQLWCRILLTAGPVTVPHVPGTGMRAAVRFILPFVRTRISFNFFISVPHSPFLSLPHSSSWSSRRKRERERTSLCKSREYVRLLSATLLYQPHLHSRGRLCHSIIIGLIGLRIPLLVFSSAIPKNLADDPYWGKR